MPPAVTTASAAAAIRNHLPIASLPMSFVASSIAYRPGDGFGLGCRSRNDRDMLTILPIASSFGALHDGRDRIANERSSRKKEN
jgi:hypothetical protein